MRKLAIFSAILSCAACAQSQGGPNIYPNAYSQQMGPARMEADKQDCMAMATEYAEHKSDYTETAKAGAIGVGVGAGTGALAGVITKGKVGRTTAAGAAIGGVLGVVKGLSDRNQPNPSYQQFVNHCLERKGYEVMGWN